MTNSAVLKHVEEAIFSDEQQMDAAMSEKIARYAYMLALSASSHCTMQNLSMLSILPE